MPRRAKGPRLYFQKQRGWIIRDGTRFIRVGSVQGEAEKALAAYIGEKHKPQPSSDPWIADILNLYLQERVPQQKAARNNRYQVGYLLEWWGTKRASEINKETCREYAKTKTQAMAAHGLRLLSAAVHYWHGSRCGPLGFLPVFERPPERPPRDRYLTKREAATLLRAANPYPHIRRLLLIGLHTGSRPGVILSLTWEQLDLEAGVMERLSAGETPDAKKRKPPVRLGRKILGHLRRWKKLDMSTSQVNGLSAPAAASKYVVHWNGLRVKDPHAAWKKTVKKAGLVGVSPHTLRHTRATWLMQAGVPIWEAAGHLGMTPRTLETVYGKHSPDFQEKAANI